MRIIFIGGLFPVEDLKTYIKNSKGVFQFAADKLQKSFLKGFKQHYDDIQIITVPFLPNFPDGYKGLIIKRRMFSFFENEKKVHLSIPFINLKIFDLFFKAYSLKKALKKEISDDKERVIIVYGMFSYFLKALPSKNKGTICLIVPDLPDMMGGDTSKIYVRIYLYVVKKVINKNINKIDCFVLLSKQMSNYLNISNKPWTVVEGICDEETGIESQIKEKNETILYTGTLAKRYGILNLLESFSLISDENYRLWICGGGDGQKEVELACQNDPRIKYFGQIGHSKVLELQQKASILVNPRISNEEFTKYSFPSKTMEYLASGTPTIIYKLDGIPDEYYDYCFCCENQSALGLYNKIMEVSELSQEQKNIFGTKARNFILENKNSFIQSEKVLKMINKVNKYKKINNSNENTK